MAYIEKVSFRSLILKKKNINDFPKLSIKTLKNEITFGSYQINECLSYLADHLKEEGKSSLVLHHIPHANSMWYCTREDFAQ